MERSLETTRISGPGDIKDSVLHTRATEGWRDAWTRGFVALTDGCESGLLMLDFYERTSTARVYEIFVLGRFRQRRIGTGLMELAEAEARKYGAKLLELEAHPLDESTDLLTLRQWYSTKGFDGKSDTRLMSKVLRNEINE
ncbi:GNAT family N-acetyltransferase [Cupriavidus sp. D39]|uniref:GNAT family N-acetyltransferase n=1 Tax=Cupriavidus sp. D39 TaxID=2997877 RepID=UPI00226DAB26|nr:GNAT family N-acetyltransferase [Cupriavidus sp. D39]MCY0852544.1 GNAT family N-acetyltransferase [Cupriavidus sp. D39]